MSKNEKTFQANFEKLEKLSTELQQNKVTVDELVPRMKDALEAIQVCKEVLKSTKAKLVEINKEFEEIETQA